jgi:hypothetical protein
MSQSIEVVFRKHTADWPDLPAEENLESLRPEILAALEDSRNVLTEMLRLDLAHSGGFAERLGERLARVEKLLDALK